MARILVVERDNGVRELLGDFFASLPGYTVNLDQNARSVLHRIKRGLFPFDLAIVTNHGIPGIKGVELIEQIKRPFPRLPIILISGLREPVWHTADAFFSKPFDIGELLKAVARLLETEV